MNFIKLKDAMKIRRILCVCLFAFFLSSCFAEKSENNIAYENMPNKAYVFKTASGDFVYGGGGSYHEDDGDKLNVSIVNPLLSNSVSKEKVRMQIAEEAQASEIKQVAMADSSGIYDEKDYRINIGDTLKVSIFDERDLSGEYNVDSQGNVNLPLIGNVLLKNKTIKQAEKIIATEYGSGYLLNPTVSVETATVKPFFVMGEVNDPGSYVYKNNLNVINAIATAGGYTYRANKRKIYIKRHGKDGMEKVRVNETDNVLPGDVIIIKERFF